MSRRTGKASSLQPGADRNGLHCLHRHHCLGDQPVEALLPTNVRAEAGRHAARGHADHPAQRLAGMFRPVDHGDDLSLTRRLDRAKWRRIVDPFEVGEGRRPVEQLNAAERQYPRSDLDAAPGKQLFADGAGCDASCGFACRSALEDVAEVARVAVLQRAGEIGMAGSRRREPALDGRDRVDAPRIHHLRPVLPVTVRDREHERGTESDAVAQPGANVDAVVLDLLPSPASVAVLPPGELAVDRLAVQTQPRRNAGEDRDHLAAVGFAGPPTGLRSIPPRASLRARSSRARA